MLGSLYTRYSDNSIELLFANHGIAPQLVALSRSADLVFSESWVEPGVWGPDWVVSNIRRTKYLRGMLPSRKPVTTKYPIFHVGNRDTGYLAPRSKSW